MQQQTLEKKGVVMYRLVASAFVLLAVLLAWYLVQDSSPSQQTREPDSDGIRFSN